MCVPSINTAAGVRAPAFPASSNIHRNTASREFTKSRKHVFLDYEPSPDTTPYHPATYREISTWVSQEYGLKAASRHVTQVKRKHGIVTQGGQSRPLPEGVEPPQVPSEIETAIEAALRHFHML